MLALEQLILQRDTVLAEKKKLLHTMNEYTISNYSFSKFTKDSVQALAENGLFKPFSKTEDRIATFPKTERNAIFERALNQARAIKNYADILLSQLDFKQRDANSYLIEIYRKFTLSIACLVLFFIGAPLGSIIRKGGLGWPLAYSIVFFIIYHVTSIIGEKSAEKQVMSVFMGMWFSTLVLMPIGFFLTIKAANDSNLFNLDFYLKLFSRKSKSSIAK